MFSMAKFIYSMNHDTSKGVTSKKLIVFLDELGKIKQEFYIFKFYTFDFDTLERGIADRLPHI